MKLRFKGDSEREEYAAAVETSREAEHVVVVLQNFVDELRRRLPGK